MSVVFCPVVNSQGAVGYVKGWSFVSPTLFTGLCVSTVAREMYTC